MGNPQKPFAYLPKPAKKIGLPLNFKWDAFPSNYVGMCTFCLHPYQKLPALCTLCKEDPKAVMLTIHTPTGCNCCGRGLNCTHCGNSYVRRFPPELLPWRLLPPNMPRVFGWEGFLTINTPFRCHACVIRYTSLAIYSSLCGCVQHSSKKHYYTCRYCCKEVDTKLIKAINKARSKDVKDVIETPPPHKFRDYFAAPTTFRNTFGTAFGGIEPIPEPFFLDLEAEADYDDDDDDDDD